MAKNKIVEGTGACPICGKWNSLVFFSDGSEKWNCFNDCHALPEETFEVYTPKEKNKAEKKEINRWSHFVVQEGDSRPSHDDREKFIVVKIGARWCQEKYNKLGEIVAKNWQHAQQIQELVARDYRLHRKTKNKAYTPCK